MLSIHNVIQKIQDILSYSEKTIALHEPCFGGNEWKYVKECLDTGWVSSVGPFVERFEREMATYVGRHLVDFCGNNKCNFLLRSDSSFH